MPESREQLKSIVSLNRSLEIKHLRPVLSLLGDLEFKGQQWAEVLTESNPNPIWRKVTYPALKLLLQITFQVQLPAHSEKG